MLRALGALALRSSGGGSGSGALTAWGGALAPSLESLPHALTNPWLCRPEGDGERRFTRGRGFQTSSGSSHGHSSDDEGPKET